MLTFCVVNPPSERLSFDNAFVGVQGTARIPGGDAAGWAAYPALGVRLVGVHYYAWGVSEPNEATLEADFWRHMADDPYPELYSKLKIMPIFWMDSLPVWAVTPTAMSRPGSSFGLPPKDRQQYAHYLEKVIPIIVERYRFLPYRIYELSWEPNDGWGWFADDASFIEELHTAHDVIKRFDPQARLAGPTISGIGASQLDQFDRLLAAGLGRYIDIITLHPYSEFPPKPQAIGDALARLRATVRNRTGHDLPLLGTESGYGDANLADAGKRMVDHANANTTLALIMKGEGLVGYTYFYLADWYAGHWGLMFNLSSGQIFGPPKVSPKPDFPMVRQANDIIGNSDETAKLSNLGGFEDSSWLCL